MNKLTIKTSLIALMSTIIVIVGVSSFVALQNIRSIGNSTQKIGTFWIERLLSSREVKGNFSDVRLSLARFAMVTNATDFDAETQAL